MNKYSGHIAEAIAAKQNPEKALWLENYVKHGIKSRGVGIPEIRDIIKQFEKDTQFRKVSVETQVDFLNDLMKGEYTEHKLAAIIFIQLYWKTDYADEIMKISDGWFNSQWITDWNVCDWHCVRVLTPLLDKEPALAIPVFSEWNKSPDPWKARASLVPFAQSKNILNYTDLILQFSTELIKREERFCKTAVGWVLREYSRHDPEFVADFLEKHEGWTTKEVIKNATRYTARKKGRDR